MANRSLSAVVIATASGAPMRSQRPKPIHLLCGRPMISFVLDALGSAGVSQGVVVTGPASNRVSKRILEDPPQFPVRFVEQMKAHGNGDAALVGLSGFDDFDDDSDLLVLPADVPLIRPETLAALVQHHRDANSACTVLSATVTPGTGGPRITRDRHGNVNAALRASDVDPDQGLVEVPLGIYCIRRGLLAPAVRRIQPDKINGEHQLIDVPGVLASSGHPVTSLAVGSLADAAPVDSRVQLAEAEAELRHRTNKYWMTRGVTMIDPERTYIDATVRFGTDVTLFPGTVLQGNTVINDGCDIGPNVRLAQCVVGPNSIVEQVVGEHASIGSDCAVGPFASLSPGTEIPDGTRTGPFYAGERG
jgi:bifunctional UDP-N-acetylglucosamine pyrophosphorylase/glucosamine-1-phosphate N-acetyltransferase